MKDDDLFLTTVTTATLELGIDIGRLERAFQVDAPFTVSSFLQRMGRTGRRDLPPEMWFVIREDPPEARALLPTTIPWKLLQALPWYRSIWKSAGSNRHGWTGCPTACSTTRPCVPWHPAAK